MKQIKAVTYTCVIIFFSFQVAGQSTFQEGVLTYRADTLRRLEPTPAGYITSRMMLYKKGDLVRLEIWRVSTFGKMDTLKSIQKGIEVRNKKGIYTWIEPVSNAGNIALFISYEDEKLDRANKALNGAQTTYTIEATNEKSKLLGMPTEKVIIKSSDGAKPIEALVSTAIDAPIQLFFEPFRKLKGTPLQFSHSDYGWETRFTATAVNSERLPERLFEVDPKLKVMTLEEMYRNMADFK